MSEALLEVQDLRTYFQSEGGLARAVDGVGFSISRGETLAIVGESGSGKSVTSLSVMRLIPSPPGRIAGGRVMFYGKDGTSRDLLLLPEHDMRRVRGNDIGMIFQEPMSSLNPLLTVGGQIAEVLRLHRGPGRAAARDQAQDMLARVNIPDARFLPGRIVERGGVAFFVDQAAAELVHQRVGGQSVGRCARPVEVEAAPPGHAVGVALGQLLGDPRHLLPGLGKILDRVEAGVAPMRVDGPRDEPARPARWPGQQLEGRIVYRVTQSTGSDPG